MSRFVRLLLLLAAAAAMLAPPYAGHAAAFDADSLLCGPAKGQLNAAQVEDLRLLAELTGQAPDEAPDHQICEVACAAATLGAVPPAPALPVRRAAAEPAPHAGIEPRLVVRPEAANAASRAPPGLI